MHIYAVKSSNNNIRVHSKHHQTVQDGGLSRSKSGMLFFPVIEKYITAPLTEYNGGYTFKIFIMERNNEPSDHQIVIPGRFVSCGDQALTTQPPPPLLKQSYNHLPDRTSPELEGSTLKTWKHPMTPVCPVSVFHIFSTFSVFTFIHSIAKISTYLPIKT